MKLIYDIYNIFVIISCLFPISFWGLFFKRVKKYKDVRDIFDLFEKEFKRSSFVWFWGGGFISFLIYLITYKTLYFIPLIPIHYVCIFPMVCFYLALPKEFIGGFYKALISIIRRMFY